MPETRRISAKWTVSIPSLSWRSNWIPEFCTYQNNQFAYKLSFPQNLQKFNTILCIHVLWQVELEVKLKRDCSQYEKPWLDRLLPARCKLPQECLLPCWRRWAQAGWFSVGQHCTSAAAKVDIISELIFGSNLPGTDSLMLTWTLRWVLPPPRETLCPWQHSWSRPQSCKSPWTRPPSCAPTPGKINLCCCKKLPQSLIPLWSSPQPQWIGDPGPGSHLPPPRPGPCAPSCTALTLKF